MRVIISGTPRFPIRLNKVELVRGALVRSGWFQDIRMVLSGGCPGIELAAQTVAEEYSIPVKWVLPQWELLDGPGGTAWPVRNRMMVEKADALILIWDGVSPESENLKRLAEEQGLKVYEEVIANA